MNQLRKPFNICLAAVILATAFAVHNAQATPYASGITDNAGTIQFYLNESGGNVTVTYEDSSIDPNFNGVSTGTNLASGAYTFSLGAHTSYSISVAKTGTGVASIAPNVIQTNTANYYGGQPNLFVTGNLRGVGVNNNPASPYFGRIYISRYTGLLFDFNGDGSLSTAGSAGTNAQVAWSGTSSPYRLSVASDGYVMVGDFSTGNAGVWRIDPNLGSGQLFLGPPGNTAGLAAGSHGLVESAPLLLGNLSTGATLLQVDGSLTPSAYNSICVYNNLTSANIPRITAPDVVGTEVGLPLVGSAYSAYPGLAAGNGYIYTSTYRGGVNVGDPAFLQVSDPNNGYQSIWNSRYNGGASDYFFTAATGGSGSAPVDCGVSPDGKYLAIEHYDNHFTICALTNGIPDVSTIYTIAPTSFTAAGRGMCWDAADNLYLISSGLAVLQEWTLGLTLNAVTTGNASGSTGFNLIFPSASVSAVANSPLISQANSYGNPTNTTITFTRTGSTASAMTVFFSLGGTAAAGTYTASATGSITFAAGQSSTNLTIAAVTDTVARPTTTITVTLHPSNQYTVLGAVTTTLSLLNTAPDKLIVSLDSPTVYNAFSNAYASFIITRWGDTNAAAFTVSSFSYSGTAVAGTDYTLPTPITFNPGDLSYTNYINPLSNGQLPVDSTANAYVGNKTAIITVNSGSGYGVSSTNNSALLTILDSAYPTTTPLYADPLTSATDAGNWTVTSANNNMHTNAIDSTVTFGYDLQNGDPTDNGAIPLPPSGATTALRLTVNKSAAAGQGAAAGVNLYPNNVSFSGNYAVRFSMNTIEGVANTTEGPLFGINHAGIYTNWWTGSGVLSGWDAAGTNEVWASDGVWYHVLADNGASQGEYEEFTGAGSTLTNTGWQLITFSSPVPFDDAFPTNVFTSDGGPGIPANGSIVNGNIANNWADVEIKQINKIVTLSIDKTRIFAYTNTTAFTNGKPMLGYDDPFSSVGSPDASVYYSNLRVVSLAAPIITQIMVNKVNSTAVINFTTTDGDTTAASFTLQSASTVNGSYVGNMAATITQLSAGAFQAVVPLSGAAQFYRISQN
jgi:hypothetical protein